MCIDGNVPERKRDKRLANLPELIALYGNRLGKVQAQGCANLELRGFARKRIGYRLEALVPLPRSAEVHDEPLAPVELRRQRKFDMSIGPSELWNGKAYQAFRAKVTADWRKVKLCTSMLGGCPTMRLEPSDWYVRSN